MPPLPINVLISADKDGDDWTDLSGAVKVDSIRMGGMAALAGEAGTGFGFDFEDPAAAFELPARRRVRLLVGVLGDTDFLIAQGRVTDKAIARRSPPTGDVRGFDTNVTDANAHLQGIPVHRWVRPAETDVARITALADDFLSGDPRPSTNLSQFFLSSSNPIDLPAQTYDATNPAGVVADVCGQTRKRFFITVDDEIFYDADTSTAYAADLSVTDVDPDPSFGSWEFAPIFDGSAATQDGTEFYSGLRGVWGEDLSSVQETDTTAETDHDFWEEVVYLNSKNETDATAEVGTIVDERKVEELRFTFSILLKDTELLLIKYGQTFSFRAAAAGILTPVTVRCSRLSWSWAGWRDDENLWRASIEAGFPKKLAPRLSRGVSRTALPPMPIEPGQGDAGDSSYVVCQHTSAFLGTWETQSDPSPAALLITASAGGTSITIGPATGSTTAVPGWHGGARYTTAEAFPVGPAGIGILSGRIVVPGHADFTGVDGFLNIAANSATPDTSAILFEIDAAESLPAVLVQNQAYSFKYRIGPGINEYKVWRVLDSEPASYTPTGSSLTGTPNEIGASVDWTDVSGPTPPGAFTIDQLVWCYEASYGTAYSGRPYGPAYVATGDGSTTTFTIPAYPGGGYVSGSLQVFVDGVWQPATETDSVNGEFELLGGVAPDEDSIVSAIWQVPA